MNVLDRLELIRENERLNKSQFEKVLGKSTGYMNTLRKNNSLPGLEVLLKISDNYPKYNLMWILKGEGEMLKEYQPKNIHLELKENKERYGSLQEFRQDVKQDLKALAEGMTHNFEVLSRGMKRSLQGQQKILDFIEDLDPKEIKKASAGLQEFLKEKG